MPRKTKVKLKPINGDTSQSFDIEHAKRLLTLSNCAWELADSKFEFDGNDIKRRSSKRDTTKSEN
jgi:hypothetical protein